MDKQPLKDKPQPGEDWKTTRGFTVRIDASTNLDIIQAHYIDARAGGHLPVKFDLDGKKIGGREDWLVERQP
jgi:hypothetical protein